MMCGNICTQVSFQKFPSKHTHFHVPENKTDACLEYIYLSAGMLGDRHIRSHTFIHVHFVAISPASVCASVPIVSAHTFTSSTRKPHTAYDVDSLTLCFRCTRGCFILCSSARGKHAYLTRETHLRISNIIQPYGGTQSCADNVDNGSHSLSLSPSACLQLCHQSANGRAGTRAAFVCARTKTFVCLRLRLNVC